MIKTISPIDGSIYYSAEENNENDIENTLNSAKRTLAEWSALTVKERAKYVSSFVNEISNDKNDIALEITWQMGRPLNQSPGEIGGFVERANYMIEIA